MMSTHLKNFLHQFLFAISPFLFFLTQNSAELSFADIFLPLFITVAVAGIIFIGIGIFLRNTDKAAVIVSFLLVFFFSYGHVYDALLNVAVGGIEIGRARYVLPLYALVFLLVVGYLIFTRRALDALQQFLNVVAVSAVLMSIVLVSLAFIQKNKISTPQSWSSSEPVISTDVAVPDIYYIILDAYANGYTLQNLYDFDNTTFLNTLRDLGFYVADKSTSNYAETSLSIASSLNMNYVNYLSDIVAGREDVFDPRVELIQNSAVLQFLRKRGYTFITFRSPWNRVSSNPYADVTLRGGKFDELTILLVNTTLLRAGLLYPPFYAYIFSDFREQILYTFEQLGAMPERETAGPKFVFAHVLSPHPPFIFGPNGETVSDVDLNFNPDYTKWGEEGERMYIDQVTFLNTKLIETIDKILSASQTPPVIVVQSDHGPWSTIGEDRSNGRFYRERMRIINAYYLPGSKGTDLYESITPVNTFRVVFNTYFNANLPVLEDTNYFSNAVAHPDYPKTPYQFTDVTATVADWQD